VAGELCGLGIVGAEVLDFSNKCCIVFLAQSPINKVSELHTTGEQQFVFGGYGSVVLSNWASVKGTGMDCTTMAVSSQEFRKGGVKIVRDEGGNDVLFTIGDDEEMAGLDSIKVVLLARTGVYSWLRAGGTGGTSLCVSIHGFGS